MTRLIAVFILALLLNGCAHKELKAPCKNVAALRAGEIPCEERKPVNWFRLPSVFAQD